MYLISYSMLHNPQTFWKYFKNTSKIKNLFLTYFRPLRSTGPVDRSCFRPERSTGPLVLGVHVCARLPVDRSVDRQTLRSTDRSTDCMTLALEFCRSTDISYFCFKNDRGRPSGRPGPTALLSRTDRSTDSCPDCSNGCILDLFCFLWIPTAISYFQVAKLSPNDLVSLMKVIYHLPINRGHGF